MKARNNRLFRSAVTTLSVLIFLLFALFVVFFFGAQSYLNKNLSEFVTKKSKGKYELSFDGLSLSFRHWGIEMNEVSVQPADSILSNLKRFSPERQFYSFSSPTVRVAGIKLFDLLFHRELTIGQILIVKPELVIHGQEAETEDKRSSFIAFFQELKPLVTKEFKSIRVNKIEFSNASFDFYQLLGDTKKLSNAENISIGLVNFYTDSLLLPDPARLFKADDIYLSMQNYQKKLADSLHVISAETVTYSLKYEQVNIKNLKLQPFLTGKTAKSEYRVTVPEVRIKSGHIDEFYRNNAIPIDTLTLTDAKISFWPGSLQTVGNTGTTAEFDLYQLIKNEISSIRIQQLNLKNASLELFNAQDDPMNRQALKHIFINLHDFKLDSTSVQDTSRIFYAKNIEFQAQDYELTLGDNIHRFDAGSIALSTARRLVLVKNIRMEPKLPENREGEIKNYIRSGCDSIRLDGFDFKKAYHLQRFYFQRINVFNPEVRITQNQPSTDNSPPESQSFVYSLIAKYARGIYADGVVVSHGKFQYTNQTGLLRRGNIQAQVHLLLTGFALDELSARKSERLFFANQIELNFKNYEMQLVDQLHRMTIDAFDLSTRKKLARITNLHLFPIAKDDMQNVLQKYNRSELYEFTVPELTLTNTDFHQAFFEKKLCTDTLNIQTPQIYYENFAFLKKDKPKAEFEDLFQLLSDYLDDVHINQTVIADGTIRLINHSKKGKTISLDNQFDLGLENTVINKEQFNQKKLLFSQYIDFTVHNHLIRLSDQVHVLKVDELGFSTKRQEVFATGVKLYPETEKRSAQVNWNMQVTVPEIRIQGVDLIDFYFNGRINARRILISSPGIRLYQKNKTGKDKNLRDFTFLLPQEIESMNIQQFELSNGFLQIFSEPALAKPFLLVQTDLQMEGRDIRVENNPALGRPEFTRGDYTSVLNQFRFTPKDKNQQYSFDELKFSTTDRTIQARQLVVKPNTKNAKRDQFELRIPTLSMTGFDLNRAYRYDEYFFDSIRFDKPFFQLNDNTSDSLKINPFRTNLYPYIESFARIFASKSIHIEQADLNIFKNNKKKFRQTVTFDLNQVRIDDKPSPGFLHAVGFSFKTDGMTQPLKYSHLAIGETAYSSKNDVFTARKIHVIPDNSKEKQQALVGFQSDYISGKIDSVVIDKPDIRTWFDQQKLIGRNLEVDGLNLNIFRDKRLPFNEDQRPKMVQDMIKSLKFAVQFDSLTLKKSSFTYQEQPESGEAPGKIWFTHLDARLKPFTNMKQSSGFLPEVELDVQATIMDSCRAKLHMVYQMNDPENTFAVNGSLEPFNMHIVNPMLEPLASVGVRSGRVNTFDFSYTADRSMAVGQLFFGYDDLRISILENKKGNIRESKFASFLANSLFLKTKNPRGKELEPDPIRFARDPKKSVLNYWWKAVFSGMRNTLGLKESKPEGKE
jgi:hypothetical protein